MGTSEKEIVSVCVITCNSEQTICETLESIWTQTYDDLELIVADDCSWDGTLETIENWLENKGGWEKRFKKCLLLNSEQNIGVVANCNKAVKASTGDYVQEISGDDILVSIAVEKKLEFAKKNNLPVVYSQIELFGESASGKRMASMNKRMERAYKAVEYSHEEQFREMLKDTFICGPMGTFFDRDYFLNSMGGYDDRFPMMEDYPFHLKYLRDNPFVLLDEVCVRYRISKDSLCQSGDTRFIESACDFFERVRAGYMKSLGMDDELEVKAKDIKRLREYCHSNERKWQLYYGVVLDWMRNKERGKTIDNVLHRYGLRNIAIYGMGDIADILIREVNESDITVKYGIDKYFVGTRFGKNVVSIDSHFTEVDAIIITPIFYADAIKNELGKRTKIPLICLDELINRMMAA